MKSHKVIMLKGLLQEQTKVFTWLKKNIAKQYSLQCLWSWLSKEDKNSNLAIGASVLNWCRYGWFPGISKQELQSPTGSNAALTYELNASWTASYCYSYFLQAMLTQYICNVLLQRSNIIICYQCWNWSKPFAPMFHCLSLYTLQCLWTEKNWQCWHSLIPSTP